MEERGNYFLLRCASFVRKICPERAIIRYCLKSNPYAALFLPGKEFELQVIDSMEKGGKQWNFVSERVWSPETRQELYERGMWSLLGVNSLWEFEYLLKNVQPVVYLNGPGSDFRRTASFEPIIKTLQTDDIYAVFLGGNYPQVAENIGAEVLAKLLKPQTYEAMTKAMVQSHPERVVKFIGHLETASSIWVNLFLTLLRIKGNFAPLMPLLFTERNDLYKIMKEQAETMPELNVLSAVFQYFLGQLKDKKNSECAEKELCDWLNILETYAQSPNSNLVWLLKLKKGVDKTRYPQLYDRVIRLIETYAPNLLNPANRMICIWERQDWP